MKRGVDAIPRRASLREAARLAQVSGAPVVDEQGRYVGVLLEADFIRWVEAGCPDADVVGPARSCSFQTEGRLLTGEEAVICTLAPNSCPLQAIRPTTGGRHVAVCLQPCGVLCDWQQVDDAGLPQGGVAGRYANPNAATAGLDTPVAQLIAMMVADAGIHRVIVLDDEGRPVGVVSATDLLAALAWEADARPA
jgi:CBS domain-containing protein